MREIVDRLLESHRLDEAKKKEALNSLVSELEDRLSKVKGYSHHQLTIEPNYGEGYIEVNFKGTEDSFRVIPDKQTVHNNKSNRVIKVDSIDGAYIEGTKVYDADGEFIGEALVRERAIHNKSDYSPELDKAEFRFNSKITSMSRLEKYVASEAINNMK